MYLQTYVGLCKNDRDSDNAMSTVKFFFIIIFAVFCTISILQEQFMHLERTSNSIRFV